MVILVYFLLNREEIILCLILKSGYNNLTVILFHILACFKKIFLNLFLIETIQKAK